MIVMRVSGVVGLLFVLGACNGPALQTLGGADGASQVGDAPGAADPDSGAALDAPPASSPDADQPEATLDASGDAWSPPVQARDAAAGVSLDATTLDAAGPDPTARACNAAADDGGLCPLPPSTCADRRWLVYYDNGQCVSGQCTWGKRYLDCGTIGCFFGACQYPPTAQAAP
jgi:hypothetical protein